MIAVHGMARGKVPVSVPALNESACFVGPLLVPKTVEIISQVIGDI